VLEDLERGSVVASRQKGGETNAAVVSASTAKQGDLVFAVGAALALHVLVFLFLVLLALAEILIESVREQEPLPRVQPKALKEVIVELSPNILMEMRAAAIPALPPRTTLPEVESALAPPKAEVLEEDNVVLLEQRERGFMKTSEEQASEKAPTGAAFIGERDTAAGSELPASEKGPEVPNLDGEEQKNDELNLFDSRFSDGQDPGAEPTNKHQPENLAGDSSESPEGESVLAEPKEELGEESGRPKDSLLSTADDVSVPVEEEHREERREETLPKESRNKAEAKVAESGDEGPAENRPEEDARRSGFRTESRRTRMDGTIRRRGENSLNVENTPIGRYKAKVNRIIEREWQRQCITHRNHILPGILTLRFYLDARGRTSGMRFIDEIHASEIQKGFTVQSVKTPKFPAMPKEVARELDGEALEFRLNFNF